MQRRPQSSDAPTEDRNQSRLRLFVIVLAVEKLVQHALTAMMFFYPAPGVGVPDIGTRFQFSNPTMALLNIGYLALMAIGLFGFIRGRPWGWVLVFWIALLDIVLEFWFHHWFFITVSVLVSAALCVSIRRFQNIRERSSLSVQTD